MCAFPGVLPPFSRESEAHMADFPSQKLNTQRPEIAAAVTHA